MAAAAERKFDALVDQPLGVGAAAGPDFIEQCHRSLFKEPGANPVEHIFAGVALQDEVVDAVSVKQLSQQQPRRPRANDRYLCSQHLLPQLFWV